jgi:hypothetical protein
MWNHVILIVNWTVGPAEYRHYLVLTVAHYSARHLKILLIFVILPVVTSTFCTLEV